MPSLQSGKLYVPFLIAGMLITGCSNSIFTKYQDMQCVENCNDPDQSHQVLFEQPVWQTLQMFLGEMFCFIPILYTAGMKYYRPDAAVQLPSEEDELLPDTKTGIQPREMKGSAILLLWLPALCDLAGTTLMMIGLIYTPVSIYQMTRGALVLWVGLFSVMFLRRHLWLYQWLSLVTVMIGVSIVGLSGSLAKADIAKDGLTLLSDAPPATTVFVGILFILFAQVFTATQFVVEEKILSVYTIHPLLAVGYEGLFGSISILIAFPILYAYRDVSTFFDLGRGWTQMIGNPTVLWTSVVIAVSIALFNAFGLTVTRHVNATARSTADTCRTIGIWIVSLALGWEHLLWPWTPMQLLGFALLVYGTFVFNNLYEPPSFLKPVNVPEIPIFSEEDEGGLGPDERRARLAGRSLEQTAVLPVDLGGSGLDVVPPPTPGPAPARSG